jgi:Tol biopolymer transport system component
MKKLLLPCLLLLTLISCQKDNSVPTDDIPVIVTSYREHGLDVCWDQSGSNRIAYSMKEADTYYDIHFADESGGNDICLTCASALLPNKHICTPYWHPSGNWIIMAVEEAIHPGSSTDALPGFGAYCDIWIMNTIGTKAYRIVDLINDYDHGVIAPRFSHDGKQIVWTDRKLQPNLSNPMQQAGFWTIKIADFKFNPSDSMPIVSNIRTIEPVANAFYEVYGFSPDDSRLIFCSNINQASFLDEHIYTIDTLGGNLLKLTDRDYNEHGFYKPDGSRICWMSSTESTKHGTDWWMMNTDGSGKERLTYFNEPKSSQYAGHAVWAGLGSFNHDGTRFIGGVQESLITQEGKIVMVTFK